MSLAPRSQPLHQQLRDLMLARIEIFLGIWSPGTFLAVRNTAWQRNTVVAVGTLRKAFLDMAAERSVATQDRGQRHGCVPAMTATQVLFSLSFNLCAARMAPPFHPVKAGAGPRRAAMDHPKGKPPLWVLRRGATDIPLHHPLCVMATGGAADLWNESSAGGRPLRQLAWQRPTLCQTRCISFTRPNSAQAFSRLGTGHGFVR